VIFVTIAERAFRSDEQAEQIGPGVSTARRRVHELAVGQHRLDAEHVVDGETVLEAVRAAGVLGDVAADRADLLARRIGRVVVPERRDLARDLEVGHARLDRDALVRDVDVQDTIERDSAMTSRRARQRAARQPGPVAARHERDCAARAELDDRLNVAVDEGRTTARGVREDEPARRIRSQQIVRTVKHGRVADYPPQRLEKCAVHRFAVSIIRTFPPCWRVYGQTHDLPSPVSRGSGTALTVRGRRAGVRAQQETAPAPADRDHADGKRHRAGGSRWKIGGRSSRRSAITLRLTGTKIGCDRASAGVHGPPRRQAGLLVQLPRGLGDGRTVQTVEGLLNDRCSRRSSTTTRRSAGSAPRAVDEREGAAQRESRPTADEARAAMTGNICRCSNYSHYVAATFAKRARQPRSRQKPR
jgi:aerobic-type carbon monoxide dehydrogenase small subunit (CoxS/CutS family)